MRMKFSFVISLFVFLIFIGAIVIFSYNNRLLLSPEDEYASALSELTAPFGDSYSMSDALAQSNGVPSVNCVQPKPVEDRHSSVATLSAGITSGPKNDARTEVLRLIDLAKVKRKTLEPTFKCDSGCERKNTRVMFTIVSYPVSDKICDKQGKVYNLPPEKFKASGDSAEVCLNELLQKVSKWARDKPNPKPDPCQGCTFHTTLLSNYIHLDKLQDGATCSTEITAKNICGPEYKGLVKTKFNFDVVVTYNWNCVPSGDSSGAKQTASLPNIMNQPTNTFGDGSQQPPTTIGMTTPPALG